MTDRKRNFPTMHCHPQSFDSATSPELMAERETELDTGYLTVTDHGTLEACRQAYDLTKKKFKNLKPVLGIEAYFRDDSDPLLISSGYTPDPKTGFRDHIKYHHVTMHAQDEQAFFAMTRLLSNADLRAESHGSERKPLFDWATLEELGGHNVTMCSSCLIGMVSRHILEHNDFVTAEKYYQKLSSIVKPGNFYVEIFPHVCDNNFDSATFAVDASGQETRFRNYKKLRTQSGEYSAEDLAKEFSRNQVAACKKHGKILEIKNYRKWEPLQNPLEIQNIVKREGFLKNECRPWSPNGDVQLGVNKFMIQMAQKYGHKCAWSDDSHMARPEDKIVQDIRLAQMGDWRFSNAHYRFSNDDAWTYAQQHLGLDRKTFDSWVDNGFEWASKFDNFKFSERKTLPTSFYPKDTLKHTMDLIKKHGRMEWDNPEWRTRLKQEIDLLHSNGTIDLLPYFQVIEEVCDLYARNGELTAPGRGSAAGLLLSYLLGITHVDPIKYKLSKERFLTLDRIQSGKLPDIDQDLGDRSLLVGEEGEGGWLKERFGAHVAQISTNNTAKLKMSIKDVFRAVHGDVPEEIEQITKKLPVPPQGILDKDFVFGYKGSDGWVPGALETNKTLQDFVAAYPKEWALTQRIMGLVRSKGRHAAGYVISDEPIDHFIPMTTVGGVRCTAYDAKGVEAMGGLKMDFLVIDALKKIQGAVKLIQDRHAPEVNWAKVRPTRQNPVPAGQEVPGTVINGKKVPWSEVVPFKGALHHVWNLPEDAAVFGEICEGKVETVFQFDAGAARQGLRNFRPNGDTLPLKSIEDLSVFTALDRHGPLDAVVTDGIKSHNMLVEFSRRAAGEEPIGSLPILDQLLPETRGTIVFQEQLQCVFQTIGKTTAIEANNFRDDIGKKRMAAVLKHGELFMRGATESVGEETAKKLWDMMVTFGQYGFNKSHSVSYVHTSYASAWLKHHYPLEWWTSVLSHAKKEDVDGKFWKYAGSRILLPDISKSKHEFEIEGDKIRAPLGIMKGLGEKAHEQILELAPFSSIDDLFDKIDAWKKSHPRQVKKLKGTENEYIATADGLCAINSAVLKKLTIAGCLDSLFPDKPDGTKPDLEDKLLQIAKGLSRKKKKITPIRLPPMSSLELYQYKKTLLPAYQEDLSTLVLAQMPDLFEKKADVIYYKQSEKERVRISSAKAYDQMAAVSFMPFDANIALIGFVVDQSEINYKKKDDEGMQVDKRACKLMVDVEGERFEFVKWPSATGLPPVFNEDLTSCVIMLLLNRRKGGDSFFLNDAVVLASKLQEKKEEESSESETSA